MGPIFGEVRIFFKRDHLFDPPWGGFSTKPVKASEGSDLVLQVDFVVGAVQVIVSVCRT